MIRARCVSVRCEASKTPVSQALSRRQALSMTVGLVGILASRPAQAYGGQKQLAAMDAGMENPDYAALMEAVKKRRAEAAAAAAASAPAPAPASGDKSQPAASKPASK
uniref:Uncharacterized protein n=1 Tax=Chlamydomonas leiostraca TaxID=1034604 RepID=A0A7S0S448_9CHLO